MLLGLHRVDSKKRGREELSNKQQERNEKKEVVTGNKENNKNNIKKQKQENQNQQKKGEQENNNNNINNNNNNNKKNNKNKNKNKNKKQEKKHEKVNEEKKEDIEVDPLFVIDKKGDPNGLKEEEKEEEKEKEKEEEKDKEIKKKKGEQVIKQFNRKIRVFSVEEKEIMDNKLATLSEEIMIWVENQQHTDEEKQLRNTALSDLIRTLEKFSGIINNKRNEKRIQVETFGSHFTGASVLGSDIDVALLHYSIDLGKPIELQKIPPSNMRTLCGLVNLLRKEKSVFASATLIKAKVPIIRLVHTNKVRMDMTHNAFDGVVSSRLLKAKFEKHPTVIPLLNVVRTFLKDFCISDPHTGGLSSFSVAIMLITYVEENYFTDIGKSFYPEAKIEQVGEVLLNFLNYFGNVFRSDKQHNVEIGKALFPIGAKENENYSLTNLPPPEEESGEGKKNKQNNLISIISPIDSKKRVSGATRNWLLVREEMAAAYNRLCDALLSLESSRNCSILFSVSPSLVPEQRFKVAEFLNRPKTKAEKEAKRKDRKENKKQRRQEEKQNQEQPQRQIDSKEKKDKKDKKAKKEKKEKGEEQPNKKRKVEETKETHTSVAMQQLSEIRKVKEEKGEKEIAIVKDDWNKDFLELEPVKDKIIVEIEKKKKWVLDTAKRAIATSEKIKKNKKNKQKNNKIKNNASKEKKEK